MYILKLRLHDSVMSFCLINCTDGFEYFQWYSYLTNVILDGWFLKNCMLMIKNSIDMNITIQSITSYVFMFILSIIVDSKCHSVMAINDT